MNMAKFTRNQKIVAYYFRGKACLEDAETLFIKKRLNSYGILLLHGVELIFKSFLLIKNKSLTEIDLRTKYSHNYFNAYKDCLELDDQGILKDEMLKFSINMLHSSFDDNYEKLRYPSEHKTRRHPKHIFKYLKNGLLSPMNNLIMSYHSIALAEDEPILPGDENIKKDFDLQ